MKGFAKIILGALAALAILAVIALIAINLYLQSGDVQMRIRLATEQALGMPVTVKRTLYTPWSGLTLSGLSLPDPTIPDATLVDAPQFSVHFEFWPLLSRRLVISQISLSSPHLVLRQTKDRKWVLAPPHVAAAEPANPQAAKPVRIHPASYTVELRRFSIQDGSADIIDRKGAVLGRLSGLSLNGSLSRDQVISGDIRIEDMEIVDFFHPRQLRAKFVKQGDTLTVSGLECAVADGRLLADFSINAPRKQPPSFQLKCEVVNVSLATLIAEAQGDSTGMSGYLLGEFGLHGNPLDTSTLEGAGSLSLNAAQIKPFDVIQQVGMLLNVEELQLLKLKEATMQFQIHDERFLVNPLRLKTENLIITTRGPIKFNSRMNLAGRFFINEKIERQLSMIISDQFVPSTEQPGYKEVPFSVTGKTSKPETDLATKLTGFRIGNMGNVGNLLKGFFVPPQPTPAQTTDKTSATP